MELNLQLFADGDETTIDTGVEATEVTEPLVTEGTDTTESVETEVEETAPAEPQTVDVNAIYAAARRKAEAEAKEKQAKVDAEYKARFGKYTNPLTGKPIETQADYLEALDAQQRQNAENELRQKGVDPSIIQQMVENSPAVKQANAYLQKVQADEVKRRIDAEVKEIHELDSSIDSLEKVPKEVVEMCAQIKGLSLVQAFKIANYGKTDVSKADAIRQQTVNQIKGKSHLAPMTGVTTSTEVEIPNSEKAMWEAMFPDKTYAERRKLYNNQL